MNISSKLMLSFVVLQCLAAITVVADDAEDLAFRLPDGFNITEISAEVPNARGMALGDEGTLFVGTRRLGKLYAIREPFSGSPVVITLAEDLKMPNGLAFDDGDLYVAEAKRIVRYSDIEGRLDAPGEPEVVTDALPYKNMAHAWKYIDFGPDDRLYVSMGAPCNICDAPELTTMLSMDRDGGDFQTYARGIRNSVGFDWHPESGELWFTDNGRDMLGDEVPPCELNRAPTSGLHFGYPFCHGADIADPKMGDMGSCEDSVPPAQALAPHSAPLGMRFYSGSMFPESYRNAIFIAEHGSWNRSKSAGKTGYRITLVRLEDNQAVSYEPFLEGFLKEDETVVGRPVDIVQAPDGALLVSDDKRGAVYRVAYESDQ